MSPEMLRHLQSTEKQQEINLFKSDVFSFGLVLLYVCSSFKFETEQRSMYISDDSALDAKIQQIV